MKSIDNIFKVKVGGACQCQCRVKILVRRSSSPRQLQLNLSEWRRRAIHGKSRWVQPCTSNKSQHRLVDVEGTSSVFVR